MNRPAGSFASWMLAQEARALLAKLGRVKAFALQETMVPAAALSYEAQTAAERLIEKGRQQLKVQAREYLEWLSSAEGRRATPAEAQRRFTFLRLRFNAVLTHLDIFSESMSQRSEAETGVWLSGLDTVSQDALALPGYLEAPPVVCYLARGPGAAIRRARTRLPGGEENPIAIIRIPRERMIGSEIASSLVHEVGHQGAALLDLVPSLRAALQQVRPSSPPEAAAFAMWQRWISEIIADVWSICKVGVASTTGLIGVVSLPSAFVFRSNLDDPHPMPYIRVKLSAAFGKAVYPHPQWDRLAALWASYYPTDRQPPAKREVIAALEASMPRFIDLVLHHRPAKLRGHRLVDVMATKDRQPAHLATLFRTWQSVPAQMKAAPPSLVFAVLGQARADGKISPEGEGRVLADLLKHWALRSVLDSSAFCAGQRQSNQVSAAVAATPIRAIQ